MQEVWRMDRLKPALLKSCTKADLDRCVGLMCAPVKRFYYKEDVAAAVEWLKGELRIDQVELSDPNVFDLIDEAFSDVIEVKE